MIMYFFFANLEIPTCVYQTRSRSNFPSHHHVPCACSCATRSSHNIVVWFQIQQHILQIIASFPSGSSLISSDANKTEHAIFWSPTPVCLQHDHTAVAESVASAVTTVVNLPIFGSHILDLFLRRSALGYRAILGTCLDKHLNCLASALVICRLTIASFCILPAVVRNERFRSNRFIICKDLIWAVDC